MAGLVFWSGRFLGDLLDFVKMMKSERRNDTLTHSLSHYCPPLVAGVERKLRSYTGRSATMGIVGSLRTYSARVLFR